MTEKFNLCFFRVESQFKFCRGEICVANFILEVCVPELVLNETRRDKTRLEGYSRIDGTGTRLLFSGPVARKNLGNKQEGMGLLSTTLESLE